MQKRINVQRQLMVAGCAALIASTGCRSAMPKWNLFGSRNTPSAETLAGKGPTTTYPAPPSASATPTAIASAAAGTGEASPVASVASNTGSGPVTPTATNPAAAQANGFGLTSGSAEDAKTAAKTAGYRFDAESAGDKNSAVPSIPAGYATQPSATSPGGSSKYSVAERYPAPSPSAATTGGSSSPDVKKASGGGFELPPSMTSPESVSEAPRQSKPFLPKTENSTPSASMPAAADASAAPQASGSTATAAIALPSDTDSTSDPSVASADSGDAADPAYSTSSAARTSKWGMPAADAGNDGTYAPGSTANSGGYPASGGFPSTGSKGSFYR